MGKISYINASPVYYGLDHGLCPEWLEMAAQPPAVLNLRLKKGEIQLSPISSAFYAMNHKDLLLLPDLSISCQGPVMSVLLASRFELDGLEGKKVLFSQESASAASFMRMIFRQRGIQPDYCVGDVNRDDIFNTSADAVLVIGDAALTKPWDQHFEHVYDLGRLWYEMTGWPFVFAVWAVRRDFAQHHTGEVRQIHELLLASMADGYRHIDAVIKAGSQKLGLSRDLVKTYYEHLFCDLDELKIKAMQHFFDSLSEQGILEEKMTVRFFRS